jgi:pimeloyl-ACP methyl ester carboxylesterase
VSAASARDGLVCPACGSPARTSDERFCESCGMPLVVAGDPAAAEAPVSEAHARARKVRPELARGKLVRVAGGRNQAEAELIHGLLLEEGIPSLVRRSAAFDVPDFLAAGQRDILVPESGATAARELLAQAELVPADGVSSGAASLAGGAAGQSHVLRLAAAIVAWVLVGLAA